MLWQPSLASKQDQWSDLEASRWELPWGKEVGGWFKSVARVRWGSAQHRAQTRERFWGSAGRLGEELGPRTRERVTSLLSRSPARTSIRFLPCYTLRVNWGHVWRPWGCRPVSWGLPWQLSPGQLRLCLPQAPWYVCARRNLSTYWALSQGHAPLPLPRLFITLGVFGPPLPVS